MPEDREVLREIWDSTIPVVFTLSSEEVVTMQRPDPFYLMVPRVSYFPLVFDKVIKYFSKFVSESAKSGNDAWLDYEGQAMKLHYPVGLLFDMWSHSEAPTHLPWNLTVHLSNFPEDELVRCNTRTALEAHFMSTLKEADTLKHRGDIMANLQKKDHHQLWTGLQNMRFDHFWTVNDKLMTPQEGQFFRLIPLRLYRPEKNPQTYIQKVVKPTIDGLTSQTIGDFLNQYNFFLSDSLNSSPSPKVRLVAHGTDVPLETPLQWMSEHLSHPDNFIHLCLLSLKVHK